MKRITSLLPALLLCASPASAMDLAEAMTACPGAARYINAQIARQEAQATQMAPTVSDPSRRQQLLELQDEDQAQYEALAAGKVDAQALNNVQVKHLAYLQHALGQPNAVPTVGEVGRDGINALWLLIQHANGDPALQTRALVQLEPLAIRGDLDASKFALLTDRVLLASGKAQKFGSQLRDLKTGLSLQLPDAQAVQRERAALGLMALDDYRCVSDILYRGSTRK